jgi:hypothetical protein
MSVNGSEMFEQWRCRNWNMSYPVGAAAYQRRDSERCFVLYLITFCQWCRWTTEPLWVPLCLWQKTNPDSLVVQAADHYSESDKRQTQHFSGGAKSQNAKWEQAASQPPGYTSQMLPPKANKNSMRSLSEMIIFAPTALQTVFCFCFRVKLKGALLTQSRDKMIANG